MAQGGVSGTVRARQPPCGIVAKALTSDSAAHKARLLAECTSGLLHQMPETPPRATSCLRSCGLFFSILSHVVRSSFLVWSLKVLRERRFFCPKGASRRRRDARRRHLMKRPGSAACQAVDIVGCGIRSERLCMTPAIRPVGANGACGGHPDEAALPQGGETANAAEPLEICVAADIRRPQLRCIG